MTKTNNGLPSLQIRFQAAAVEVSNRFKRGIVALVLYDSNAIGLHSIREEAGIPTELAEVNRVAALRALKGSERGKPARVILAVTPPDTEGGTENLSEALLALESQSFDYLAGPPTLTSEQAALLQAWVLAQRKKYRTPKAVLPNVAADHVGIINFAQEGIESGGGKLTAAQYCCRIAGILAGVPSESSATYAPLPEVTGLPVATEQEQIEAINAGKLILLHDGQKAKIARAVNSMVTVPEGGREAWSKIKLVEAMDLITHFARTTIEDAWLGVYSNSYDNKQLLVVALSVFLQELEAKGVLQRGSSYVDIDASEQEQYLKAKGLDTSKLSEQEIREADTGSFVFIAMGGRLLDAMEDFRLLFHDL